MLSLLETQFQERVFTMKKELVLKMFMENQELRYKLTLNFFQIEYRVWNPYRSKIAAAVIGGVSDVYIRPGSKVLYLGAASGTTVSHVSDIIGAEGNNLIYIYQVSFMLLNSPIDPEEIQSTQLRKELTLFLSLWMLESPLNTDHQYIILNIN